MDKIFKYLREVQFEMMKVSWPSREELFGATLLVVILSIVVAAFVGTCDKLIYFILTFVFRINM